MILALFGVLAVAVLDLAVVLVTTRPRPTRPAGRPPGRHRRGAASGTLHQREQLGIHETGVITTPEVVW